MPKDIISTEYSTDYRQSLFVSWYRAGKPKRYSNLIVPDENNRTPTIAMVSQWKKEDGWEMRATALDLEVARQMEQLAIKEKVEMLNRQAEYGKKLQEKGFKFFDRDDLIVKEATALKMIQIGAEMERKSRGMSQALEKIAQMGNKELSELANQMLSDYDEEEITEILGEITEGEFEDV